MKSKIHYATPAITATDLLWVKEATEFGWGHLGGSYIDEFEEKFSAYIGSRYAVATSSCTGALHLGLAALGIGVGDEVILADTNWIATAAPIVHLGAKPVFVDIERSSWCIDPREVERAITKRTKAIIATHLYGNLCDMGKLLDVAVSIPVIEDAAQAIGSEYGCMKAGSIGLFGVFSFHASKTITTGEGGMLVTNNTALDEKVRQLNNHGRSKNAAQFRPEILGYKYKMTDMQAALGASQLGRIEQLIARKTIIFHNYERLLEGISGIQLNPRRRGCLNGYWMPTIVVDRPGVTREALLAGFKRANIDARIFFDPLSSLPMFEEEHNPVAYEICYRAINLPSYHDITMAEQERVIDVVRKVVGCK